MWAKARIGEDAWWHRGEVILTIAEPTVELLRLADGDVPIMGKVYYRMFRIQEQLSDVTFVPSLSARERSAVVQIHKDRWNYLHSDYHAAGYCIDPELHQHIQHVDAEVMTGFRAVIARHYHDKPASSSKTMVQFMAYKNSRGVFSEAGIFEQAKDMPAHEWWELYGADIPEIQRVAMKVLSKRSSACSVERLWSLFGLVRSDVRGSLGPKKARDLALAGSNIRLTFA